MMLEDPVQVVKAYHLATRHHPRRYARGPGYLDWATQPDPFRRFHGAPCLPLPIPRDAPGPAYDALFEPGSIAPEPLSVDSVSRFLYASLAISAWKQAGGQRWALRCNPSSGNLHPTEGYLLLPALDGLAEAPGVYHYAPREHALERRAVLEPRAFASLMGGLPEGAFLVGLSSIHWREAWKYGERAFRYCQHDVGHALAGLRLAAAMLGWRLAMAVEPGDADVARLLGLDRSEDFRGAEPEHPDLLAVVVPNGFAGRPGFSVDEDLIEKVARSSWHGRANTLSPGHVEWPAIDAVAEAAVRPRATVGGPDGLGRGDSCPPAAAASGPAGIDGRTASPGLSAMTLFRRRRSGVAYDDRTPMGREAFLRMLERLVPGNGPSPPWDAIPWHPQAHLLLFVHRVEDMGPGLYLLVRDPGATGALRSAMRRDFQWTRPPQCPEGLDLVRLAAGDCREIAANLSLGQDIAGMGAFSAGMLSRFAPALAEHGAWFYRALFWEAGMVGQMLYLEAERSGLRGTGIGAYFDEPVHELLGLEGLEFQSLYHFAVGGAVDDPRLTTLGAYPPPD